MFFRLSNYEGRDEAGNLNWLRQELHLPTEYVAEFYPDIANELLDKAERGVRQPWQVEREAKHGPGRIELWTLVPGPPDSPDVC